MRLERILVAKTPAEKGSKEAEIVEILARHEETIAELYNEFSLKFAEHKAFWAAIVKEEILHSRLLRTMHKHLSGKKVVIDTERFDGEAIENSIAYIRKLIDDVLKHTDWKLLPALETALNIERTLVDGEFFEVFDTSDPGMLTVLADIRDGTKEHISQMEEFTERLKKNARRA